MQIIEAIQRIDALKPNQYTQSDKVKWLSTLDLLVYKQVFLTHDDCPIESFDGYTDSTSLDTELLADEPYSEMYISWLESKIDYMNSEYTKYNNSVMKFNEDFSLFRNAWNHDHRHLVTKFRYTY